MRNNWLHGEHCRTHRLYGSSGGFALLGVGLSNSMASRRERRQFRTESALELADAERFTWDEGWTDFDAHLQRQETRLAVAGTPEDLIKALRDISVLCWRDNYQSREMGQEGGIASRLLNGRRALNRAIGAYLL